MLSGEDPNATCDVWALGVTLHELLTGELLFVDHHNISGFGSKNITKLHQQYSKNVCIYLYLYLYMFIYIHVIFYTYTYIHIYIYVCI